LTGATGTAKSPLAVCAGGLFKSADKPGRLVQATAFRRHDRRMMVVRTMMEVALHLKSKLRNPTPFVKPGA
jgi:hypothetical protein